MLTALQREVTLNSARLRNLLARVPEPVDVCWAEKKEKPGVFQYLTALRQSPPGVKNFG